MAKIITIIKTFENELYTYQSENEDDVLDLIKWILTENTDILSITVFKPWEFANGVRECAEIGIYGYEIRDTKFNRLAKWLTTKTATKLIRNQKGEKCYKG